MSHRILSAVIALFLNQPADAQFRIWLTDSSLKNPFQVPVAGEIRIKGKTYNLNPNKGKYRFKNVKWTGHHCRYGYGNNLIVDIAAASMGDGIISISAELKGQKSNTIVLKVPIPVRLEFDPAGQRVPVNTETMLQGFIVMSDSSRTPLQGTGARMAGFVSVKGPVGMQFTTYGGLFYSGHSRVEAHRLEVCLGRVPAVCGKVLIRPDYSYKLILRDQGREGSAGGKGASGNNGCETCSHGVDGMNGEAGGTGYMGEDGSDMDIWLKRVDDSLALLKVNSRNIQNQLYYINLKSAGRVEVYLQGGKGGTGGKGGRGGRGMDGTATLSPGRGGEGGPGGTGGTGGRGGQLTVYTDSFCSSMVSSILLFNAGGEGGSGGEGGNAGKGGVKEGAGIGGTVLTGRRGEDGSAGTTGDMGRKGPSLIHRIITY